jgi:hypothetical protein
MVLAATIWASVAVANGGCSKVSEASAGATSALASPASSAVGPAGASYENANYKAALKPLGGCKKEQPCAVEVVVEAKGDYHINEKYPYRFKTEDPAPQGLKYPKPVVGKEDGTMEEHKVTLKVPFIAGASGDAKIAGTLSLSVCSAANCLMDKQPLEALVKVE